MSPTMELTTTIIQVIKGGESDADGFALSDVRSPHALSYFGSQCACGRTALLCELWERLAGHDLFSPQSDIWLRMLSPDTTEPLPEGASLLEERTVMVGVG